MPWPRGVPRKGHVNKSGEPHKRLGRKPKAVIEAERLALPITINFSTEADHPQKRTTMKRARPMAKPQPPKVRKYTTKLAHPQYSIEPCPNCFFPEADGGHCPDCGWTRPVEKLPANSVHGRKFKR